MNYKLRDWKISDLESLVEHANNYNIAKWLTNQFPHPYTETDGRTYIEMVMKDCVTKVFAIDINGEAVGSIGIFPQADIHMKSAEIGYWLSEKYWGKGIMAKAIEEIVDYGFRTFDIVRIYARPFSTNIGSQRVLEKAGFKLEARLKKALYKSGEYLDELIYSKINEQP
ncbi:GNAT family protein [uncultured Proteiniphilum sp.]|uniref:GNAT family N-acetyltransferase n=1 Tax=uncultured Proteiniphilum sp. TaxID=497637 RepID=UPI002639A4E4|nr:GNAT family protein [uncultured Proteiniphilum sp.]